MWNIREQEWEHAGELDTLTCNDCGEDFKTPIIKQLTLKDAFVKLTALVNFEDRSFDDRQLNDAYKFSIPYYLEGPEAEEIVLDMFHESIPVKVLDDFIFDVQITEVKDGD